MVCLLKPPHIPCLGKFIRDVVSRVDVGTRLRVHVRIVYCTYYCTCSTLKTGITIARVADAPVLAPWYAGSGG